MWNGAARRVTVLVAILAAVGCSAAATGAEGPQVGPASGGGSDWYEVVVQNGTPASLRVFAMAGNSEIAIGRVDPLSDGTMRIPAGMGGQVRLVARPLAATVLDRQHASEPFTLQPGHRVRWDLRASPGVSDLPRISTIRIMYCPQGSRC